MLPGIGYLAPNAGGQVTGLTAVLVLPSAALLQWAKPTREAPVSDYLIETSTDGGASWTAYAKLSASIYYSGGMSNDVPWEWVTGLTPGTAGLKLGVTPIAFTGVAGTRQVVTVTTPAAYTGLSAATYSGAVAKLAASIAAGLSVAAPSGSTIVSAYKTASVVAGPGYGLSPSIYDSTLVNPNTVNASPSGRGGNGIATIGAVMTQRVNFNQAISQHFGHYFTYSGRAFEFLVTTNAGNAWGVDYKIRYSEDDGATWKWAQPGVVNVPLNSGAWYVLIDFGTAAARTVEIVGGYYGQNFGFHFETGQSPGVPTGRAHNALKMAMFIDSFTYGQGAYPDFTQSLNRIAAEAVGSLGIFNHGLRGNRWGYTRTDGNYPCIPDRLYNGGAFSEIGLHGALDVVFLCATINDGAANTTPLAAKLRAQVRCAFEIVRSQQPTALIFFVFGMHAPEGVSPTVGTQAYLNGWYDALGADPGAWLIDGDAVASSVIPAATRVIQAGTPWIASGANGSAPTYFYPTATASTNSAAELARLNAALTAAGYATISSGTWAGQTPIDIYHPTPAGHVYLGGKIAAGVQAAMAVLAPAVPANTAAPAITGTAQVGQTLTSSTGTWSNSPTGYAYQWLRGGVAIAGATAASYVQVSADLAASITVRVTASNAAGAGTPASSAAVGPVAAASSPVPVNSVAPAITGTARVGQTLTSSTGTWSNSPTGYAYQWLRAGVAIAGATGATYPLVTADVGAIITVRVVASNAGGSSAAATSAGVGEVLPLVPSNAAVPEITGTAQVGQTLTSSTGIWSNSPNGYAYQWLRGGVAIAGATSATYLLVTADLAATITVQVVASNTGGSSTAATSAGVGPVAAAVTANIRITSAGDTRITSTADTRRTA